MAATILVVAGILLLLIVFPLTLVLLWGFQDQEGNISFNNFAVLWQRPIMQKAVRNTILLVAISVPLGTIVVTLVGYVLTCTDLPARRLMRILISLPMIFPPFTGAMGLLMLFGRRGLITYYLLHLRNFNIYGPHGIILLQTIGCIPLLSLIVSGTFAAIGRDMEEAAEDLGAGRLREDDHTAHGSRFPLPR
ncbi:MAG: ABC transporter permease [bacterium]